MKIKKSKIISSPHWGLLPSNFVDSWAITLPAFPKTVNWTKTFLKNRLTFPNLRSFSFKLRHFSFTTLWSIPCVLRCSGSNGFLVRDFTRLVFPTPDSPRIRHCPWNTNCLHVLSSRPSRAVSSPRSSSNRSHVLLPSGKRRSSCSSAIIFMGASRLSSSMNCMRWKSRHVSWSMIKGRR